MAKKVAIKRTPEQKFNNVTDTLSIKFASKEAALHFKTWLCEAGEQDYWTWMAIREQEESGDITAVSFDYHTDTSEVVAKCGRLDRNKS